MKKTLVSLASVAMAGAVFAAANDTVITFSTKGPDMYADGTSVLDGECYALVWTKTPSKFTVAANGDVAGGEIVLAAPVAKNGCCPRIRFTVDADLVESEYNGGKWKVYLLDTRVYGDTINLARIGKNGLPTIINAADEVVGSTVSVSSSGGVTSALVVDSGTTVSTASSLPADVPQPTISGIEVKGGNVYVTVANAAPYLTYDLSTGDTPDAVTESVQKPCTGGDDGKVILVAPAKEGGAFFRVNRK